MNNPTGGQSDRISEGQEQMTPAELQERMDAFRPNLDSLVDSYIQEGQQLVADATEYVGNLPADRMLTNQDLRQEARREGRPYGDYLPALYGVDTPISALITMGRLTDEATKDLKIHDKGLSGFELLADSKEHSRALIEANDSLLTPEYAARLGEDSLAVKLGVDVEANFGGNVNLWAFFGKLGNGNYNSGMPEIPSWTRNEQLHTLVPEELSKRIRLTAIVDRIARQQLVGAKSYDATPDQLLQQIVEQGLEDTTPLSMEEIQEWHSAFLGELHTEADRLLKARTLGNTAVEAEQQ